MSQTSSTLPHRIMMFIIKISNSIKSKHHSQCYNERRRNHIKTQIDYYDFKLRRTYQRYFSFNNYRLCIGSGFFYNYLVRYYLLQCCKTFLLVILEKTKWRNSSRDQLNAPPLHQYTTQNPLNHSDSIKI